MIELAFVCGQLLLAGVARQAMRAEGLSVTLLWR